MLTLPNGKKLVVTEVLAAVDAYRSQYPAVFDLYDLPFGGPHDEVLPIDLLAVNAMNAWAGGQPMNGMTAAWMVRHEIAQAVTPVSHQPLELLDDTQADEEAERVGAALQLIDDIKWFGYTATAKFFHRLRPNLGPIWDKWIGEWYGISGGWMPWVKRVYAHVREPGTRECLIAARDHLDLPLSLLRVWDVILWQLRVLRS